MLKSLRNDDDGNVAMVGMVVGVLVTIKKMMCKKHVFVDL